jgi:diguanylate cyclase (GGDEF)-like protein/PAS domain S-box-containing protein
MDSTDTMIWSVDLDFRLIFFNRAFRETFQAHSLVQIAETIRLADLLPPGAIQVFDSFYNRALAEGPFRVEHTLFDGHTLELAFNPIVEDGKTTGVSVFGRNINQCKAAREALKEAEKRYREIFDEALEGIFQASAEGKVLRVNNSMARMMGYDSPQDAMTTIKDVALDVWVDPEERASFLRQLQSCGAVRSLECRFKRKDGAIIWVSLTGRKVCGTDGRLLYSEGMVEDITERKRVEERLQQSMRQLQLFVEDAPVSLAMFDREMRYVLASQRWVADYGLGISDVRGMSHYELYPEIPEHWKDSHRRGLAGEVVRSEADLFPKSDGRVQWIRWHVRPWRDVKGDIGGIVIFTEDITERKQAEIQLRDSEERFRKTFEQAGVGIIHASFAGTILRCNTRFADIVGYPPEEIPGMTVPHFTLPEDIAPSIRAIECVASGAATVASIEKRYLRKDGSVTWVKMNLSTQRDGEGRALHLVAFIEDINARKAAEERLASATEALRVSEASYRSIFQTSQDFITVNRLSDGMYINVNQAFYDIMGFNPEEIIGHTSVECGVWANTRDRQNLVDILRRDSKCRNLETRFKRKNGEVFSALLSASTIEIDGVPCIVCIMRDISDAQEAATKIRNLAFFDPLTHLPNRRLLVERLRRSQAAGARNGHKRALLFVDLDNFKTLNDTLGHQTGDLLLQDVARRMTSCVRESDTVARLGGDEFVVLLEDLSATGEEAATQARVVADDILMRIRQPYLLDGHECRSAASIGITIFGEPGESVDALLQKADIAMYQAKAAGRNTMHFFAPVLQAAVNARAEMETDLRRAIAANQFVLYYQPQMDHGRVVGAEALIRWNHPVRGQLQPNDFIPLAEETGLILPLGDWVLQTACAQIAAWGGRKETAHIMVAVNVSSRQFRQPEFVQQVLDALDRTGAKPENLELELTESMLVENIEDVIAKMNELRSHGLRFALDDFGTGYSSLSYLKRLPLDQLKIDRSFVRDILTDPSSAAIARAIISMGQAMGLPVIAEGVETEEQRGFLAGLGCYSLQGFLFSLPLPIDEFQQFLPAVAANALSLAQ